MRCVFILAVHVELWHDWGLWFRLGIPGVMMTGLEWWVCEAGSLTAGTLIQKLGFRKKSKISMNAL